MASRSKTSPAARRPAKRRRRSPILGFGLRLSLVVVVGVGAGYLLSPLAAKAIRPYRLGSDIDAKIADLQVKIDRQIQANAELERRAAYLQTDEGKEALARSRGFHLPGEVVFLQRSDPL